VGFSGEIIGFLHQSHLLRRQIFPSLSQEFTEIHHYSPKTRILGIFSIAQDDTGVKYAFTN
jgi:hypothetical protein